ncbi:MAG: caspase family protein [Archangium sp.]|nr:caspase family protein [Archangium sp.]MDP3154586.1 caspase family protein [Archangium sp.]MDP3574336.1 caspase family protein [Archangium sp.]
MSCLVVMCRWALLACLLCAAPSRAGDVRLLLSIGNNVGDPSDEPLEHAERDAERVATLFLDLGQIAPPRVQLVLGQTAPVVRERIAETLGRVKELMDAGEEVSLFVFVSAHGKNGAFHLKGTHLSMAELRALVEHSGARFKLVVVDACESGAITRAKGARAVPEFTLTLEPPAVKGSVYLSSSGPAEASQEFASLKGSLFTHHWLTGLRGDADVDGDGRVSLGESYSYTFRRTVAGAAQAGQHPVFDIDAAGAGDVILSQPGAARSAIVFPPEVEGNFVLMSQPRPDLVAEVSKARGRPLRLAVTPGRYVLRKRLGMSVGLVTFELPFGGVRTLDERELTVLHFAEVVAKGSSFEQRPLAFFLEGSVESEQLVGAAARWRGGAGLRATFGALWLRGAVSLTGGQTVGAKVTTGEWQGGVRLSAGWRYLQWPVIPFAGLLIEGRVLSQRYQRPDEARLAQVFGVGPIAPRTSLGLTGGALLGLEVPLAERFFAAAELDALLRWLPAEGQPPVSAGLEGKLSLGVRF